MCKTYIHISLIIIVEFFLIISCQKETIAPVPVLVNITLSTEHIYHTPTDLTFKVNFVILDSRADNGLTEMDIKNYLYIQTAVGSSSGITYTYTLDTINKIYTPLKGNYYSSVMIDESEIEEDQFNNLGPTYVLNQETACRKFFKSKDNNGKFILASYATENNFLPDQPITIFGNNFSNDALQYDQILADLRRYSNMGGRTPFLSATDSMLEYIHLNSTSNNNQLIAYTHSEDNVGGMTWNNLYTKAKNYNIPCNIVMTYQGTYNSYEYTQLACETGGFLFFVENHQDGGNLPLFGDKLNDILKGNLKCFETIWTVHASQPVFYSGTTEFNWIELYMDNNEKIYTYMPYYVRIP